jgi:hypothetical protein
MGDSHFKFGCVSCQTFPGKGWHPSPQFSRKFYLYFKLLGDTLMFAEDYSQRTVDTVANPCSRNADSVANPSQEPWTQLPIFLADSKNHTLDKVSQRNANQKSTKIGKPWAQMPILLQDSKNLEEGLT